jgi:hypothetical protein
MKIRIKGNSIRYRLTKTNVEQLSKEGYLEETTTFGNSKFIYALQQHDHDYLSANFQNNTITLFIGKQMTSEWALTERVGFTGTNNELHLLVEKDFMCMDITVEDQSDNYPNPLLINK